MPKFSANLSMMYADVDFLDRFERAAGSGFKAVEFMFPYDYKKEVIVEKLQKYNLLVVLHNFYAGNWAGGERGLACLPDRVEDFKKSVPQAIEYAKALKCPRLNCMAGLTPKSIAADKIKQTYVENLRFAADALQKEGLRLLIEPINHIDMPGFHLNYTQQALDIIKEVNHPNIYLQYDIYHAQMLEGNLTKAIRDNIKNIDHLQLADVPGRHEPGTGEINFTNLFRFIDEADFNGWIGCEYRPTGKTEDGLSWITPYLKGGK
jgi:hydroxypyruvate isomerase